MKKKYLFFLFSVFVLRFDIESLAQNKPIDSLQILIKNDATSSLKPCLNDTNKIINLIALCNEYRNINDFKNGLKYGNEALQMAINIDGQKFIASAYNNIGNNYYGNRNYNEALKNYFSSLAINEVLKNKKDLAGSYLNIGIVYYYQNKYPEALKNYNSSLNLRREIGDKLGIANSYTNIGLVYDAPGSYPEALKNYFSALKIYENIDDRKGIVDSYNNIGRIFNSKGNYSDALKMYSASLKINEGLKDNYGAAFCYKNMGNIYWNKVNYPSVNPEESSLKKIKSPTSENSLNEALLKYSAALKIWDEIDNKPEIVESYINLGNVHMDLKKLKEAKNYLDKALILSKELGSKEWIKESYSRLEELDSIQGNWKSAYEHQKLFILYKDSIKDEELRNESVQSILIHDFEKKEAIEKAEFESGEIIKKRDQTMLVIFVLVVIFSVTGYKLRSKRLAKQSESSEKKQSPKI